MPRSESQTTNTIDLGDVEKRTIYINFSLTAYESAKRGFFFTFGGLVCISMVLFLGDLANRIFG